MVTNYHQANLKEVQAFVRPDPDAAGVDTFRPIKGPYPEDAVAEDGRSLKDETHNVGWENLTKGTMIYIQWEKSDETIPCVPPLIPAEVEIMLAELHDAVVGAYRYCNYCNYGISKARVEASQPERDCPNCRVTPVEDFYEVGSDMHRRNCEDYHPRVGSRIIEPPTFPQHG
tara:strand:- start:8490 stop:9005 length:516 start_codon:yes stop_codon:yes gene_type:complete